MNVVLSDLVIKLEYIERRDDSIALNLYETETLASIIIAISYTLFAYFFLK